MLINTPCTFIQICMYIYILIQIIEGYNELGPLYCELSLRTVYVTMQAICNFLPGIVLKFENVVNIETEKFKLKIQFISNSSQHTLKAHIVASSGNHIYHRGITTIKNMAGQETLELDRSSASITTSQSDSVEEPQFIEYASFVFPDFRAVYQSNIRSLENIVYEEVEIDGFEIYLVEQWAARRKLSTLITSYNGNTQDKIRAVKILLPKDISLWPDSFKKYHEELLVHSRPKVVNDNTLFITNLSTFPSALNLLHIDSGDFRTIWEEFKINYNLKRLRCVGRSALLLSGPSTTSGSKFAQLYKVPLKSQSDMKKSQLDWEAPNHDETEHEASSEEPNIQKKKSDHKAARAYPVIELVTIIQTCLHYFSLFDFPKERNGLLCDYTKKGINKWWERYGKFYLGIEKPRNEATMGPTTVASIISLVLCCYFKLMVIGCMSGKEPFDEEEFFSGIYNFQKKNGLSKKNCKTDLNEATIERLFEASAKVSNTDIFNFKTVVKSTVQDITGRGNFIQLSNDILTTDLDTLIKNIYGGKLFIIWKKPERSIRDLNKIRKRDFTEFNFNHGDLERVLHQQELYYEKIKLENNSRVRNASERYLDSKYDSHLSMKNLVDQSEKVSVYSDISMDGPPTTSHNFYKNEYFRRKSISHSDETNSNVYKMIDVNLLRCSSLSDISDALEVWSLPFDASVVRIARDMLKTKDCLLDDDDEGDVELEGIGSKQNILKSAIIGPKCVESLEQFNYRTTNMQKDKNKLLRQTPIFKEHCEGLENKNMIITKEMKELESLASQMKYNIRILTTRMRDVEVNVNRFDCELERIDKELSKLQPNLAGAVDDMKDDDVTLDKFMNELVTAEQTKYGGIFHKLLEQNFLDDVKNDIKGWIVWAFEGLLFKEHEQ